MKNRIISIGIILMLIFTSLISVEAIAPTPRVDLDEYQLESTSKDNVLVTGTVTIGKGQLIGVYDSAGRILYNYTQVANSGDEEDFKIQIPAIYLKDGDNTFKVKSIALKGVVNSSNPKTVTVKIKSQTTKKDQTITVNNIEVKVRETKNLNAKTNSGLTLTYTSNNTTIATVDNKGNVIGRKAGTTTIVVKQAGNNEYNPASKTITVTVKDVTPTPTPIVKKNQTITTNFDSYQFSDIKNSKKKNLTKSIGAKASSKLALTYKSNNTKVATVDSSGKITAKSAGTAKITITQKGNNNFKPVTKTVTIIIPNIKTDEYKKFYSSKVMVGQATSGEGGSLRNNRAGDQSGGECAMRSYYRNSSYGNWKYVFRAKNKTTRLKIADACIKACNNNKIGYDQVQPDRKSCYKEASKVKWQLDKIKNKCELTCSELANVCMRAAGISSKYTPSSSTVTYPNIRNHIRDSKQFYEYSGSTKNLEPGDILISTSHTALVVKSPKMKTYTVKGSCTNGTLKGVNRYLTGTTVKITYKPISGKKLKSVTVDGKKVNIKKYPNSYTFKNLNKNHTVTVVFG